MLSAGRLLRVIGGGLAGVALLELALQGLGLGLGLLDAQRRGPGGGDFTVLCLGACYTLGLGLPADQSYPALLEDALRDHHPGLDARVVNGGVRGKNIDHFSANIEALLDAHQPDVVVVNINRRLDGSAEALAAAQAPPAPRPWDALVLPRLVGLVLHPPAPGGTPAPAAEGTLSARVRATEQRPDDPAAWAALATALIERDELGPALAAWHTHLALSPDPRPAQHMRLFGLLVGTGDFAGAAETLALVRQRWPDFAQALARRSAQKRRETARADTDMVLREAIDEARVAIVRGGPAELARAAGLLEGALARDPDTAEAWSLLAFLRWTAGETLDPADALGARAALVQDADVAHGLRAGSVADADAARDTMETLLALHIARIAAAAEARGARVVLENLSTLPAQQAALARIAAGRDLPLVDLQGGILAHPDRRRLFHSAQHLRLSADGNHWIADQIHAQLDAEELVP